jgi:hypothetical protein
MRRGVFSCLHIENRALSKLPADGFNGRPVGGLKPTNVQRHLAGRDKRHAVVFRHVHNPTVDGLDVSYSNGAASLIRFTDVPRGAVAESANRVN